MTARHFRFTTAASACPRHPSMSSPDEPVLTQNLSVLPIVSDVRDHTFHPSRKRRPASTRPDVRVRRRGALVDRRAGHSPDRRRLGVADPVLPLHQPDPSALHRHPLAHGAGPRPCLAGWTGGSDCGAVAGLRLLGRDFLHADNLRRQRHALFATAPFMAAVLGWIVLRERVRRATWVAVFIAIGGIAVMVSDQTGPAPCRQPRCAGVGAGLCLLHRRSRAGKSVEMLPAVFLSGLFALVMMGSICLFTGDGFILSRYDGGIALGMGVFQVGAGPVLFTLFAQPACCRARPPVAGRSRPRTGWVWLSR